ncbi:protein Hook homolog 3 isoform X2 [Ischnura elegans]|uniref:protein Hook homolog 3 isoform X2 n=1 Tax=Ischnura elegans TaxID=197161 RepID=UPI001ED869AB|nr:protein Hook homolog 3 isoform X2 [Ischnura elegans]
MDDRQHCVSLIKWLQTFEVDASHTTAEEISDGVAMAQALNQIDPEWFHSQWMSKIKTGIGNSWRLKVSNLKKIVEGIVDYYQDCLNLHADFVRPDVLKIGEKSDPAELARLLQLILGCAVNCNKKQEYIKRIMDMEESLQQVIMQSIQELENNGAGALSMGSNLGEGFLSAGLPPNPAVVDTQLPKLLQDLEAMTNARDWMAQRCHELDMQVKLLQEEKSCVLIENEKLKEKLKDMEALEQLDMKDISGESGHKYKELRKQLESCKEEMYKMEQSRDDYKAKVGVLEKELADLQARQEELQAGAEEARQLKDEMDILRETAEKVARHEAMIEVYKKKLEEYGDLKRQVKLLEEKNTDYMQQNMDLEEELKKSGTWKPQVEIYKKKTAELQQKLSEESKKADKAEFENKKLQEKFKCLSREKERLIIERDSLKEANEELRCAQLQMANRTGAVGEAVIPPETIPEADSVEIVPPTIKEKILRLQHENKMLKMSQHRPEEARSPAIEAVMDDMDQMLKSLRDENRVAHQRILELESQLEEFQSQPESHGNQGGKHQLASLEKQLKFLQEDVERKSSQLDEKNAHVAELNQKIATIQESMHCKEMELQAMEEKFQRCIKKAQSVVKSLGPKENTGDMAEINALQSQLAEKDKIIEYYKREFEKCKIRDKEGALLVTAYQAQSLEAYRNSVDQRLSKWSRGSNCLSRHRQATNRRLPPNFNSR